MMKVNKKSLHFKLINHLYGHGYLTHRPTTALSYVGILITAIFLYTFFAFIASVVTWVVGVFAYTIVFDTTIENDVYVSGMGSVFGLGILIILKIISKIYKFLGKIEVRYYD